ncbi:putative Ribulose-phosphate 3-epimerase [Streptomyces afghaniensis 772]|uniref:Putative Ribulose-phosphate 3-epimerase n=1 Tax=Streptomyces afghaniensis 772 TaxID=1283301 RepID=S4MWY9_9ACTN|nr:putative Ribulose-phosphate 3-epimerase [Streptomyces afghaniensis 772]
MCDALFHGNPLCDPGPMPTTPGGHGSLRSWPRRSTPASCPPISPASRTRRRPWREPTGSTSTSWTTISSRTSRSVCRS